MFVLRTIANQKNNHGMDISVNAKKVKDTKDEEHSVTNNSNIEVIKAPGYFKIFKCGKTFLNKLEATYERVCMENVKGEYWS